MDEQGFSELYDRTSRRLLAFASRRLPRQAAEEVVARTYETVWLKREECPADADAQVGWVFAIGRFAVVHELDRTHRKHHDHRFAADHGAADATYGDPCDTVHARWVHEQLTDDEREVFDIAFMTDLTREEGAAMLGLSLGAFTTRVARLRARIAELLEE